MDSDKQPTINDLKANADVQRARNGIWAIALFTCLAIAGGTYKVGKTQPCPVDKITFMVIAGAGALGAVCSGLQFGMGIKDYRDIKKELSQRTNEKQK